MYNNRCYIHPFVFDLSDIQLRENHKEHCKLVRQQKGYRGDIKTNWNGVERSIARGPIAVDGAGNTRAYNHFIRGKQHSLIVYSLIISKPLLVLGHQVSCHKFSRQLTKIMNHQKVEMNEIQFTSTTHGGKCYRNSKVGPSTAEEVACEEAGEMLLLDDDGNILPDDEAIFAVN